MDPGDILGGLFIELSVYTKGLQVCFVLICNKQVLHFADVISVHI